MDALAIILSTVRSTIEATGVPPDALQTALADAERRLRGHLGGGLHHISRAPHVTVKAQVLDLAAQGLSHEQIAQRLGITDRYARMVTRQLRVLSQVDGA